MRRTFLHSMNGKLVRHSTAVYQSSAVEFTVGSHDRAYHSIQTPGFFWSNRLWVRMSRHYIHTTPSVNYCSAWDCNTLTHLLQSIWNTISSWKYSMLWSLPHVWMHSRGKTMPLCLCVCRQKNIDTSSRVAKATQRKTIILEHFCTWYKSRWFFSPLFQLLPIISFLAPPLSNCTW